MPLSTNVDPRSPFPDSFPTLPAASPHQAVLCPPPQESKCGAFPAKTFPASRCRKRAHPCRKAGERASPTAAAVKSGLFGRPVPRGCPRGVSWPGPGYFRVERRPRLERFKNSRVHQREESPGPGACRCPVCGPQSGRPRAPGRSRSPLGDLHTRWECGSSSTLPAALGLAALCG